MKIVNWNKRKETAINILLAILLFISLSNNFFFIRLGSTRLSRIEFSTIEIFKFIAIFALLSFEFLNRNDTLIFEAIRILFYIGVIVAFGTSFIEFVLDIQDNLAFYISSFFYFLFIVALSGYQFVASFFRFK